MKTANKFALLVGAAAGYVLGARAGRERYEQIAAQASKVWESKPVQQQVNKAQGLVDRYVPKAVEGTFRGAGTVASGLVSQVMGANKRKRAAASQPSGTVERPAN
ncbi:hypothetical protein [Gulosibacter bifidus]|uniref:YtxH domain-containing protein n=1 Tax=Gulosibacter bifidus TaxID=272239 RepID=A0ABW5RKJ6_9MICO|nr:hypothetical protein [Gulosibacter bifidus]